MVYFCVIFRCKELKWNTKRFRGNAFNTNFLPRLAILMKQTHNTRHSHQLIPPRNPKFSRRSKYWQLNVFQRMYGRCFVDRLQAPPPFTQCNTKLQHTGYSRQLTRPLPPTSAWIHYSLITPSFDTIWHRSINQKCIDQIITLWGICRCYFENYTC